MICHKLTVEIRFYETSLGKCYKQAFGELNNFFQDEFNKILSQQSTNVSFFVFF